MMLGVGIAKIRVRSGWVCWPNWQITSSGDNARESDLLVFFGGERAVYALDHTCPAVQARFLYDDADVIAAKNTPWPFYDSYTCGINMALTT